ncbi:DUF2066 domain-containing protein [Luteimonas vadosa]|uniref:DUF2066 domain-containing protein n=2 Tax=Luteimonas vadosa TaxID=1165507 RepID=A0ABP9DV88_9GAMM
MDAGAWLRHHSGMNALPNRLDKEPGMARCRWMAAWVVALGLAVLPGLAAAQRMEGDVARADGLYSAEVPVTSQTASARQAGFARALVQVLAKLSGDKNVAGRPGVGRELRHASDFVDGYDFRQDEGRSASGAPTYRTTLVVRFKPSEVDAVASALGLPIWPQPRPKPVLWLAIDDGRGPRLVSLKQNDAARPVLDRAIERGYRLGLPSGTAAEQAAVGAIWRGDTGAIARLSSRYSPPKQLIGKLYRHEGGWKADWIFVDEGRVLSRWSEEGRDARRLMATGAEGTADALTRRYAKAGTAAPPGEHRVVFTGLHSADDFIRLSAYLQSTSVVRRITPVRATPEALELELDLLTGLSGFRRVVDESVLAAVSDGDAGDGVETASNAPVYRLR